MPDSILPLFSSLAGIGGSVGSSSGGGGFLSSIAPWLLGGSSVLGTVGNIEANQSRNSVLNAEIARMNAYNKLTPGQVTSGITSLEQPLSQNLTNSVGNTVQGQLAERGLSQAPGIFTQALGQGLAPYQLQEQQLAQQAFFQKLGLPISAQPSPFGPYPQTSNASGAFQGAAFQKALQQLYANNNPSGGTGSIPGLDNIMFGGLTPPTGGGVPTTPGSGGGIDSLNFFNNLGLDTSGGTP